jgi:aspartate/methionine/tyrosine aminotransferase
MNDLTHILWAKQPVPEGGANLGDSAVATPDLAALGLPENVSYDPRGHAGAEELGRVLGARWRAPGGQVRVAAGASEANAVVLGALLQHGHEVLIESPGYEPHRLGAGLIGARVRTFPRPLGAAPGAVADAVERALTRATKLVVVSHMHNPSGTALDEADFAALDRLAASRGFRVLVDETFRDADPGQPLGTAASRGACWIVTSSLTKSYGLGGLRIGWIAADAATLERCAAVHDQLSSEPSALSVSLAMALAPHLDALRARTHRILATNRPLLLAFLARQSLLRAAGESRSTCIWAELPGEAGGDAFSEFARQQFRLRIVPGRFFGDSRGVRITLGAEPEQFAPALAILERATAAFAVAVPAGPGLRAGADSPEPA